MKIAGHDIAVCSWSLRAASCAQLADMVHSVGLEHVQLAIGPLVGIDPAAVSRELASLKSAGIAITAGMIGFDGEDYSTIASIRKTGGFVPDGTWPQRREIAIRAARITADLGVRMLSVHVGFVPPSDDPRYPSLVERMRELAGAMADFGVDLLMETGQEAAGELLQFLNDVSMPNVGINFDPANMILYGAGHPIDAVRTLGRHIRHVHVKDAVASDQPQVKWGEEVPFGTGQVGAAALLRAFREVGYTGPLAIEREAGDNRLADVRTAIESLRKAAASL